MPSLRIHRQHYVDAHIAIRRWAQQVGAEIEFWTHDYQGAPDKPASSLGRPPSVNLIKLGDGREIRPDGIFGMTLKGESRLFVLELHNRTPTKGIVTQLHRNFLAAELIRSKFLGFQTRRDPFVLSIFTNPKRMIAVKQTIADTKAFNQISRGLIFTSLPEKGGDPLVWQYLNGTTPSFFGN